MRIFSYLLAVSLSVSLVSFATIAAAKQINAKAHANRTTVIYIYGQYNQENCSSMAVPNFSIKSVDHGKISGIKRAFKVRKGICKGKSIKGIAFKYTPDRGYRGYDKARVILTMPAFVDDTGNRAVTLNFNIDVR